MMAATGSHRSDRSIPAPAGEPCRTSITAACQTVYPRACGGTGRPPMASRSTIQGQVYPRACGGTVGSFTTHGPGVWVYPRACGGTGTWTSPQSTDRRVYPRACGGTGTSSTDLRPGQGLSPRLRGTPSPSSRNSWSIPAPAGEPVGPPRRPAQSLDQGGLSPRLRGNRRFVRDAANGG